MPDDEFIFHLPGCLVWDSNYGLGRLQRLATRNGERTWLSAGTHTNAVRLRVNTQFCVRCDVTVTSVNITAFYDVKTCCSPERYKHYGPMFCLHLIGRFLSYPEIRDRIFLQNTDTSVNIRSHITYINPWKTKRRPLYLKTQSVPRCKHFSSRL
jgi:hypothetical protein